MPLKELLSELLRAAKLRPGVPRRTGKLMHGLGVAVLYSGQGLFKLQLEREKTFPGDREWKTVISCLPPGYEQVGAVTKIEPSVEKKIEKFYLRGTVKASER
jgi:hypothetical protein